MRTIPFAVSKHFLMFADWLKTHRLPGIESKYLPPTGYVILDNNGALCCGFLYKADGGVCTISHIVANPARAGTGRAAALDLLMHRLIEAAKMSGYDIVSVCVGANLKRMNARYRNLGFIQTNENMNMLVRSI